ncbi:hypothetical protein CKL53_13000 [Salmonella enterica subsp. enterica serovar Typhi]|nr:hypothetical protein [Salmonella enterica subsp. enterica serovar Typhi]CGY11473.1 BglB family transcriptional antiterminator [Salmonella enterica subsp. enterica serovar Typhi]CHO68470.1 BglB family transcriptional antiterminator [Salmonella enterica subsp. enterica serovar Typhi]
MKLTPNFYRDRVCLNVLAGSKDNAREIYAAAEGHVLVGVLSKNYPDVASAVADMREYAALIDNALSVGLGAGDPNQSAMVSEISRQVQPQHVNQVFTGVGGSRALLGQNETVVNGLVSPTGTPGLVKISTGPLSSRAPDGIVPIETAIALLKDMGGSSVKYFPMGGLTCRDEYKAVADACARHDFWLEPTGGIDLENFAEILHIALDAGVSKIIPHIYSSIIDKVSGNTRADDVRQSEPEVSWLKVHIAARQVQEIAPSAINADDEEALVHYILNFINTQYNYNQLNDKQLHADLLTHIKTMITRVRYQIMIPNPLLENIKQHYPMAWDMTLAAISSWGKYTPYTISENEIGFLVLHIGVGLERSYNIGYQRQPQVLLVCDAGNAMVRMIEAVLARKYPQIEIARTLTLRDYEARDSMVEDFVISTARIGEKDKPVIMIAPFPTDYQLEQIGKLVLVDRTRPWMLDKYFDASHFRIVEGEIDQQTLFKTLCDQLHEEGFVDAAFLDSVIEREAIVSTLLGDGIALPHALGLLAKKTVVYTVLAPQGIAWGDETAHVIFLLAISKSEYEEAMAIYDIFVTFLRERAMTRLCACQNFTQFKTVAMECVSRF